MKSFVLFFGIYLITGCASTPSPQANQTTDPSRNVASGSGNQMTYNCTQTSFIHGQPTVTNRMRAFFEFFPGQDVTSDTLTLTSVKGDVIKSKCSPIKPIIPGSAGSCRNFFFENNRRQVTFGSDKKLGEEPLVIEIDGNNSAPFICKKGP